MVSNHFKSLLKYETGLLAPINFRGNHSIATCFLHYAPEEIPEYLSKFGKLREFLK